MPKMGPDQADIAIVSCCAYFLIITFTHLFSLLLCESRDVFVSTSEPFRFFISVLIFDYRAGMSCLFRKDTCVQLLFSFPILTPFRMQSTTDIMTLTMMIA
jgi:hypothetical protein